MMRPERLAIVALGDSLAACCVVERAWGQTRVMESFSIGCDLLPGGPVPDLEALSKALKPLDCSRVLVGLPLFQVILERIELPSMKKADLEQALPFELERHLPLPLNEFVWSYARLPSTGKTINCLVAAVRRTWTEQIQEHFGTAGFAVVGFRINHLELARDLGARIGSGVFAAVRNNEIEWAEILEGRVAGLRNLPIPPRREPLDVLVEHLPPPAAGAGYQRVALQGQGGAGLALSVREQTRWETMSVEEDAAFALAQGHFRRRGPDILLGGAVREAPLRFHRNLTAGLLVAAVLLSFLSGQQRIWRQQEVLETMKEELGQLKKQLKEGQSGVDGYSVASSLNVLREFSAHRNHATMALIELARRLPADAWLHSFDLNEKGRIEISGFAEDSALLVESLADSPHFSSVQWQGTVIRDGRGSFKIRMMWKGNGE